jgi:hypothetical protein
MHRGDAIPQGNIGWIFGVRERNQVLKESQKGGRIRLDFRTEETMSIPLAPSFSAG